MANWTYQITVSGDHYMKDGNVISATIRRTSPSSVSDIGLYSLTGSCSVSSNSAIQVYAHDVYLTFGSYFWIGALGYNEATHSINETGYDLSSNILSVGTSGTSTTILCDHSGGTGNGCYIKNGMTFTVTIGVNAKYDQSIISCGSPVNFGNSSSVSFTNSKIGDLNHKVTWTINSSYTYTMTTGTGATSASYQIPTAWLASCPSSTSIECTVAVETLYNNNSIGVASQVITLSVPDSVKPSIGSLTSAIYNDTSKSSFATNNRVYIQNLCGVKVTANSVSAGTGSSIDSYAFSSTAEDDGSANSNVYTITKLQHSGSISFSVTVKDKRGRTASASCSINVIAYNAPVISAYDAYRCTSTGTGSETGTYAQIRCAASVSPVSIGGVAKNSMTITGYYYVYTTGTPSLVTARNDMASGTSYIVGGGNLSTSSTYYARFVVTDSMGGSAQADIMISSAAYAIHVKNGGTGVAFGKTSEHSQSVEINPGWSFYYKGFLMAPVVYSETDEPSNPVTGLIWLKKK